MRRRRRARNRSTSRRFRTRRRTAHRFREPSAAPPPAACAQPMNPLTFPSLRPLSGGYIVRRMSSELIHTCYRITDIDKSVDFYEKLGFEELRRMPIGDDEATNVFMG